MKLNLKIVSKRVSVKIDGKTVSYDTYKLKGKDCRGQRVRFQNQDKGIVLAEKQRLEIEAANAEGEGPKNTHLTAQQLRQAEEAFRRIARHEDYAKLGYEPLSTVIDYFVDTYRAPGTDKSLAQVIDLYLVAKKHGDVTTKKVSDAWHKTIANDLGVLKESAYGAEKLHIFTHQKALAYMTALRAVPRGSPAGTSPAPLKWKRWNNIRGMLHAFFAWCIEAPRNFITRNPISDIIEHEAIPMNPVALTPSQSLDLMREAMEFKDGALVPYFALTLFAGVRPAVQDGEIYKLGFRDDLLTTIVNPLTGLIHLPAEVAKNRVPRQVTIQPNLRAWLDRFPLDHYPIMPVNADKMIAAVRKKQRLGHDIMRHTFISAHIGKFHSIDKTAKEAGNSAEIIREHYHDPMTEEEAEIFWAITPDICADENRFEEVRAEMHRIEAKRSEAAFASRRRMQPRSSPFRKCESRRSATAARRTTRACRSSWRSLSFCRIRRRSKGRACGRPAWRESRFKLVGIHQG